MLRTTQVKNPAKVRPLKMTCDRSISAAIPEPLPAGCFRMMVIGAPGSGKSVLATSLLLKRGAYYKKFDRVWIIQPSNSRQSYAKDPWKGHTRAFDVLTPELLQRIIDDAKQLASEDKHTLVFIDDFAYQLKDRAIERLLREMYFNARHLHLSSIIVAQTLRSIGDKLRKSASHLVTFEPANRNEARIIADEFLFIDAPTAAVLFEQAFQKRFDFMLVDTQQRRVWSNFEREIELPRAF